MLHAVARSETFTNDILRACTDENELAVEFYKWTTENGNTALHIAAMSKHQCSEILLQSLTARTLKAEAAVTNKERETPFSLVLKKNRLEKELRKNKVRILLQNGYQPTVEDLRNGCKYENANDFKLLFLSVDVLTYSKDPLRFLLVLALYCQERSRMKAFFHTDATASKFETDDLPSNEPESDDRAAVFWDGDTTSVGDIITAETGKR